MKTELDTRHIYKNTMHWYWELRFKKIPTAHFKQNALKSVLANFGMIFYGGKMTVSFIELGIWVIFLRLNVTPPRSCFSGGHNSSLQRRQNMRQNWIFFSISISRNSISSLKIIYCTFYFPCRAESQSENSDRQLSVCLYVRLSVNLPNFFQNHCANFNQTWHKAILGHMKGRSLFQGEKLTNKRKYIDEILELIFYRSTGAISTKFDTNL